MDTDNLVSTTMLASTNDSLYSFEMSETSPAYTLVFFLVLLIIFGIPGNVLVLYVVVRNGAMKTVTNLYLVNLSIADLIFLSLVVPSQIMLLLDHPMTSYLCKVYQYIVRVTLAASILTLVSMAADRFYGVMYPMKCRLHRTLRSSIVILAFIWFIAFTTQLPVAIYVTAMNLGDGWSICFELWPGANAKAIYNITFFVFFYVAPLLVIGGCYGRMAKLLWHSFSPQYGETEVVRTQMFMRRKIAVMILVVVICFAACWFIFHFNEVFVLTFGYLSDLTILQKNRLSHAGRFLGAMNSALNPFLYAFLSANFRRCFYRVFPCISKLNIGSGSFIQKDPDEKTLYTRRSTVGRSSRTRLTSVRSVRNESGNPKPQPI
ncbi:galanin receptor type 1-like [Anneissia japonica]|uniref:galanin receptor type 1-like n=1 Tax=Anneissia japonica TaxID=1529436 RepID=UPI0014256036|nr:galanin receptor type 1-like [Anneissia japonica]